jgi:branched-chain amino acid transport system permease protein
MPRPTFWPGALACFALAVVAALTVRNEYFFFAAYVVMQFVVLATAWNILGGYAGYVNFGTAAFFGIGSYTAIFLAKSLGLPLLVQVFAAAIVGAVLGLATGLLTLRMRGIFFSIATIAVAIILETFIVNWKYVGGATGIQVLRPPPLPLFDTYVRQLFVLVAALALGAVALARFVETSRIGLGLRAIRDDETAAECSGVPTLRLKLLACALSGSLMAGIGAPSAMYLQYADPASAFNMDYSISALAMAVIGGTSRWVGPVLGAALLATAQQVLTVTIQSELNVLVLGLTLIVFVIGAPDGLVGLWTRAQDRFGWVSAK